MKSDNRWVSGKGISRLVTVGDPRLRVVADECTDISELKPLCDQLVTILRECNGAGLAATQIGRTESVVVIEVRKTDLFPDRPISPLIVMINPKVMELAGNVVQGWEGCFSIPGLMAKVPRNSMIEVSYVTLDGEVKRERFEGYIARVILHEIDHLNGVLFTDCMDPTTLTTVDNWKKFHHE